MRGRRPLRNCDEGRAAVALDHHDSWSRSGPAERTSDLGGRVDVTAIDLSDDVATLHARARRFATRLNAHDHHTRRIAFELQPTGQLRREPLKTHTQLLTLCRPLGRRALAGGNLRQRDLD